jgi:hypothetical protein
MFERNKFCVFDYFALKKERKKKKKSLSIDKGSWCSYLSVRTKNGKKL